MNKEIVLPADEMYVPAIDLRAGNVTAIYEEGRLRYVTAGDTEIVRMIYPALRDEQWATVIPVISNEKISREQRSFYITYTALYEAGDIRFKAVYKIEGRTDNTITFSIKGEGLSNFKKRRIGLCLLHPIASCTGREIEVRQPDNTTYSSSFPEFVSPFQPFLQVQGMKWMTANNTFVEIGYEGDIFETEDQRNWSDNSYKTYSTPQSVPAPAMVNTGDTVEQKITIKADVKKTVFKKDRVIQKENRLPFPRIGYTRGVDQQALTRAQIKLLAKIPFDHYRVQLNLAENWKEVLSSAAEEAEWLSARLELIIIFDLLNDEEINAVIDALRSLQQLVHSILILSSHHETVPKEFFAHAYEGIKNAYAAISIGFGTGGDFSDLNGNRPAEIEYDFVSFSLQPQVHTKDNRSIMDNLGSHETLVRSADKFTGGKPVHISPVGFSSADTADKRFGSAFAAWWTLLALRNLSAASDISFYELTGSRGIINGEAETEIYKALREIKEFLPRYIFQNTGNKVILQNESGNRLVFTSKLPLPDSAG
jgi:hypothetical protein